MSEARDMRAVPGRYVVGGIVSLPVATEIGIVKHKGILSDQKGADGFPLVIHNGKIYGGIIEHSMTDFFRNARGPMRSEGYPSKFAPSVVLERARSRIGQVWRPWDNCEHFVHWAHGVPERSPELRRKAAQVGAVAIGGALFVLTRGAI